MLKLIKNNQLYFVNSDALLLIFQTTSVFFYKKPKNDLKLTESIFWFKNL